MKAKAMFFAKYGADLYQNLVAYYPFESNANSLVGTGKNGTLVGSPTFVGGKVGNAINFGNDTAARYAIVADNDDFTFPNGTPFSISLWFNCNQTNTGANMLLNKRAGGTTPAEWQFNISVNFPTSGQNRINFVKYSNGNTTNIQRVCSNDSITTNQWTHVVVTDNGSGTLAGMKMYVNNVLQNSAENLDNGYVDMSNTTSPLVVGINGWSFFQSLKLRGQLDEVAIWKGRELTVAEKSRLWNNGNGRTYANL